MSKPFDPYHKWLAISPRDQPANHYRLLGTERFESDPDVIEGAADQRMAHLRSFQNGPNGQLVQQLLNEIAAAKVCLLNPTEKGAYDQRLRSESAPNASPRPSVAPPAKQDGPPASIPAAARASMAPLIVTEPKREVSGSSRVTAQPPARSHSLPLIAGVMGVMAAVGLLAYFFAASAPETSSPQNRAGENAAAAASPGKQEPPGKSHIPAPASPNPSPPELAANADSSLAAAVTTADGANEHSQASDADRRQIALLLAAGARLYVHVGDRRLSIRPSDSLPEEPFWLETVVMPAELHNDEGLALLAGLEHVEEVSLSRWKITDASLASLAGVSGWKQLNLEGAPISDAGLVHLAGLVRLESLRLNGTRVTGAGLASLQHLQRIHTLRLADIDITDEHLPVLAQFRHLAVLMLGHAPITDAGMPHIGQLSQLTDLSLAGCRVTDEGLVHLKSLTMLAHLGLGENRRITGAGLVHLKELPSLTSVALNATSMSDAAMPLVAEMPRLTNLSLYAGDITDAGLVHLRPLKQLTALEIGHTQVTDAGVEQLQRDLPMCKISRK